MFNLRTETIKATMNELRIDNSPFNMEIIREFIKHISDSQLQQFYMALFNEGAKIFNGLDRVSEVANSFKEQKTVIPEVERAKRLIALMESTNTALGEQARAKGEDFVKLVRHGIQLTLPEEDIAILDLVKPYSNHKELIINIRYYQTSSDSLNAFVNAIKYFDRISETEAISGAVTSAIIYKN